MDKKVLYTYRYMWKNFNSDSINFKIVTDTLDGHSKFVTSVSAMDCVENLCREYLCEYDCSKLFDTEVLFDKKVVSKEEE